MRGGGGQRKLVPAMNAQFSIWCFGVPTVSLDLSRIVSLKCNRIYDAPGTLRWGWVWGWVGVERAPQPHKACRAQANPNPQSVSGGWANPNRNPINTADVYSTHTPRHFFTAVSSQVGRRAKQPQHPAPQGDPELLACIQSPHAPTAHRALSHGACNGRLWGHQ